MKTITTILFVIVCAFSASCAARESSTDAVLSVQQTSDGLIEGSMAAIIDKGSLDSRCPEVVAVIGQVFQCSAFTEDEREIFVEGTVQNSGRVLLKTLNVIMSEDLFKFEVAAVDTINKKEGRDFDYNTIRCEDENIILVRNKLGKQVIVCSFVDPSTADIYNAEISVIDITTPTVEVIVPPQRRDS